MSTKAVPQINV